MAAPELAALLAETALATSAALALTLLLRRRIRMIFGACAAYLLWWLVPVAWLAMLVPARVQEMPVAVPTLASDAAPVGLLGRAMAAMPPAPQVDVPLVLLALWLAGGCVAALAGLRMQRAFVRNLGELRRRDDGLLQAAASAGLPAAIGLRTRIVLPADFESRYDPHERELILAHERVHVARGDVQANAAFLLFRCLYWFNPLVWLSEPAFRRDQELACDQWVVARYPFSRRAYGEAMLKTQLSATPAPLACHWFGDHPLRERVEMLKQPRPGRRRTITGAAAVSVLLLSAGYAAWAAQPPARVMPSAATGQVGARSMIRVSIDGTPRSDREIIERAAAQAGLRVLNPEIFDDSKRDRVPIEEYPVDMLMTAIASRAGMRPWYEGEDGVRFLPAGDRTEVRRGERGVVFATVFANERRAGEVLQELTEKAGLRLVDADRIDADRRVSMSFQNTPLETIYALLGMELGLSIDVVGNEVRLRTAEAGASSVGVPPDVRQEPSGQPATAD